MGPMVKLFAALLAATVALPASAQDWGDTAAGSMTITVIIAPIGAAVAAAEEGAVGAWSVSGLNDGVLLGAPDTVGINALQNISLFNNANSPLSLTSSSADLTIMSLTNTDFRGLKRQDFSLALRTTKSIEPLVVIIASI